MKRVYHNADAALDIPANFFWEEILEAFPDCKVILSEREEDSWVKSFENQLEMFEKNNQLISRTHLLLSKTSRKFYDVEGYKFLKLVTLSITLIIKTRYQRNGCWFSFILFLSFWLHVRDTLSSRNAPDTQHQSRCWAT